MAYTSLTLITRAYYLSGVVARDLQTVTGSQISDGLFLLNALLDFKGTDLRLIPYFQEYDFNTIANQEMYFVPNLNYCDSLTFNIGTVRYSMRDLSRKEYFGTPRVDNISNLPFTYRVERVLGGANVYMYFLPGQVFQMRLWGKFDLQEVTLDQDLTLTYDTFYIEYLRYALAEYICSDYGVSFPAESMAKYKEIEKKLLDVSPPDLRVMKQSYFTGRPGLDWQQISVGVGWVPF